MSSSQPPEQQESVDADSSVASNQTPQASAETPEEQPNSGKSRRRGVYLLPNLLTTSALFSGFYAIVAAMNGHFENAAVAIFVAMVLDGLDGRVARMTNTQSAFGAEYDSLSDMVSFGVAPALVAFSWTLSDLGKLGWIAAFIYVAGAALRLARFNTQIGSTDKRYFVGLPSPSAAAVVAGMVWCFHEYSPGPAAAVVAACVVAGAGIMMVSNVLYYSFKDLDLKGRVPFANVLIMVGLFALIAIAPAKILFIIFLLYTLSGPVISVKRRLSRG
jgi:CDP-diacylglycerol--serine O-phosphatidyltransferase